MCEMEMKPWLRDYIVELGQKRAAAKDDVQKNTLKLSQNSPYGKFSQDPLKQLNLGLFTDVGKFVKASSVIGAKSHIITMEEDGTSLGLANVKPRKDKVFRAPKGYSLCHS